jgi:hypothetical protein
MTEPDSFREHNFVLAVSAVKALGGGRLKDNSIDGKSTVSSVSRVS